MRNSKKNKFLDNKKNSQNAHFKKRMIQRYGIYFNHSEKAKILNDIKYNNDCVHFLYKQSNTKSVWGIEIQGKKIPVAYDDKRKNLITCLTWDMIDENIKEKAINLLEDL